MIEFVDLISDLVPKEKSKKIEYIKENKLENQTNSKIIIPDEKLKFLLGIEDGQELTYFNIQKYMTKHFIKNTVEA